MAARSSIGYTSTPTLEPHKNRSPVAEVMQKIINKRQVHLGAKMEEPQLILGGGGSLGQSRSLAAPKCTQVGSILNEGTWNSHKTVGEVKGHPRSLAHDNNTLHGPHSSQDFFAGCWVPCDTYLAIALCVP